MKFLIITTFIICTAIIHVACTSSNANEVNPTSYYIIHFDSSHSKESANYLFDELSKRSILHPIVFLNDHESKKSDTIQHVTIKLDTTLLNDAELNISSDKIELIAKTNLNLKWLINQLIKNLSHTDKRINPSGLPPELISMKESKKINFAFSYREPFYSPNLIYENNSIFGTNNLENDWGIWGHNLGKLMKDVKKLNCFSLINNVRNQDQICFSSPETFQFISNFIMHNKEENNSKNFMIAPNDNELVCTCDNCLNHGNTSTNATGSVVFILKKLAKKFPEKQFITIDYLTVNPPTDDKLPKNVGVFISAINLKNTSNFNSELKESKIVESKIKSWKKAVNTIYIWEYSSNFDNYLSPFPNLYLFQKKLEYYKKLDVLGVFCNASGYDYSVFEDLKTYVMSSLLINPDLNIEKLITDFYKQEYPNSSEILTDYCLNLERDFLNSKSELNMYGGINDATYINRSKLLNFYNSLTTSFQNSTEIEKEKLGKILTAIAFTIVQKSISNGFQDEGYAELLKDGTITLRSDFMKAYNFLKSNYNKYKILSFKENDGSIKAYLNELEMKILTIKKISNKLYSKHLTSNSSLDEGFENTDMLVDGVQGLPSDYHTNWYFNSSGLLVFTLPQLNIENSCKIKISFINNPQLKLYPPEKVLVKSGNIVVGELTFSVKSSFEKNCVFIADLILSKNKNYTLEIIGNNKFKKIACDEISIFK